MLHKTPGDFISSLTDDISRYRKHARRNSSVTFWCYVMAILSSALSTLMTFSELIPNSFLGMLSALPGLILLFNSVLALEAKAGWYWKKARLYDDLLNRIQYESFSITDASKEKRDFDKQMEEEYPRFGMLSVQTRKS